MIRKKDLGTLEFIAKGAVGNVYRLPNFTIPGCPPLAYKEVRDIAPGEFSARNRQEALDAMAKTVAFRAGLSQADRGDLDEYTTWPIEMVEDNGAPCGMVMPLIPPDFFVRSSPRAGNPRDLVVDLSWLCAKESQAQNEGIDRSGYRDLLVRIALLAQLVYAVGRLHRHGIVYGDLSLKNAALAVNPPRVKLLDCDAAAELSDPARVQLHSPAFTPPENASGAQKVQDDRTDIYKLALCVIRGLQQGRGVTQTRDPAGLAGKLDAPALDVITRAVGADRGRRPTAKELFDCLEQNLLAKASPPTLRSASLNRTAVPRGLDLEVSWEASGGKEVCVLGPNGFEVTLPDPGTPVATYVITPPASGEISVEVRNAHGTVRTVAGSVQVYDLPAFRVELDSLPRPVMSGVPAVMVPPVLHALPSVPTVSTAAHPAPRIELPSLEPVSNLVQTTKTILPTAPAHPELGAAAARTTESVREMFDQARQRLRAHVAGKVDAAVRRGVSRL
ncbi:hypothetical protein [Amycolatopsis pithecellobii]|uniref:Protein kinase domain-containing protein n=1 Tax=Amycolatopsis pithecellobii TaxID=664692 RepID=A0A6N7YS61_9PSEU|nr:hypothetical protein [Amycolatopsis pithecellobii]MTD54792.1 hypothetical protein [Amycolatopsis pithecellobii]